MFSLWLHHFLTLSTLWKETEIVEKERSLLVFDNDSLNFIFLPTVKITARLTGKIGTDLPAAEGLNTAIMQVIFIMSGYCPKLMILGY